MFTPLERIQAKIEGLNLFSIGEGYNQSFLITDNEGKAKIQFRYSTAGKVQIIR